MRRIGQWILNSSVLHSVPNQPEILLFFFNLLPNTRNVKVFIDADFLRDC